MGCESSDVIRFDLGPLLQGQMRVAKLESAYNLLIIEKGCLSSKLVGFFRWIHLAFCLFKFFKQKIIQGKLFYFFLALFSRYVSSLRARVFDIIQSIH